MSRKDRHQSTENNETQEPWEQPIYDTDDEVSSRISQRQQKKGNTLFLSLFLILLVLCIAIPAGAYFWIRNGSSNNATAATSSETSTSVVESSTSTTKEESTETSTVESSTIAEESTVSQDTGVTSESSIAAETTPTSSSEATYQAGDSSSNAAETTPSSSAAAGSTTTVQAGEGPKQVAERAGITTDQLFELNGLDPNNFMLYPGQELRIK